MAEVLDERQSRHIKNAVLLREETQTTYLDHGLAVPHGRTTALDSMYVSVGISPEGASAGRMAPRPPTSLSCWASLLSWSPVT